MKIAKVLHWYNQFEMQGARKFSEEQGTATLELSQSYQ